jgi:cobalt-zinc-cadmium resistance protein CzcA
VVQDVQKIIETQVKLPVGYTISYGGQFENLNSAKARLKLAVPIALLLIFIMLHFAFNSIKDALMIFSAIPLSAVGGVLFLWMRGLPFSISAGVGFIALFGIAVLNGIVLIEHLKELKERGMDNVNERILKGTKERLRPVILTAAAAALGFLPMAVSSNAGAEVQRPLATVVIGGLITATVLTLVVLPVLYALFETKKIRFKRKGSLKTWLLLLLLVPGIGFSQMKPISLNEAIEMGVKNNKQLNIKRLSIESSAELQNSAFNINKTNVYYNNDKTNLAPDGSPYETYGVSQTIEFPSVYFARKKTTVLKTNMVTLEYELSKNDLMKDISKSYYYMVYLNEKLNYLKLIDSLYDNFSKAAKRRFELGDANYLEMITAQSKYQEYATQLNQLKNDINIAHEELQMLIQNDSDFTILEEELSKIEVQEIELSTHLINQYYAENNKLFTAIKSVETQQLLPDLDFNFFNSKDVASNKSLNSFQAGISVPLFFFGNSAKISSAKIEEDIASEMAFDTNVRLQSTYNNLLQKLARSEAELSYYNNSGKNLAVEILKTATQSYKNGEIDFFQYIQSIETSNQININYLTNLNSYNQIVLEINYLNI